MSHKSNIQCYIDNKEVLINALTEMGYEATEEKKTLSSFGWKIETDITVTKKGKQMNIGFIRQKDGTYKTEADFWGTGTNQKKFQEDLNTFYGKHKVTKWFKENRYQTTYEKNEEGNLVVIGTKWD